MYQLPKALALIVILFSFCVASLFNNQSDRAVLPLIFSLILTIWLSTRLITSPAFPPFHYSAVFLAPAAFLIFFKARPEPKPTLIFLNLMLAVSSLYAIFQTGRLGIQRPWSLFGNPVFAAEFTAALLPFSVAGLCLLHRSFMLAVFNLVTAPAVLVLYSSRGVFISSIIPLIIITIVCAYTRSFPAINSKKILIAIFASLLFPLLVPGFYKSLASFSSRIAEAASVSTGSVRDRAMLAKTSLMIFMDNPSTGAGSGGVRLLHQKKQSRILAENKNPVFVHSSYAHNDYLQLLAETGIPGLALFLALVFSSAFAFERAAPHIEKNHFIFAASAASSVTFFMSESFFNFPLFSLPSSVLFFSFLGIMAASSVQKHSNFSFKFGSGIITPALILFILACLFFTRLKPAFIVSDASLKQVLSSEPADNNVRLAQLEKSAALNPYNFHVLHNLAAAYISAGMYDKALSIYKKSLSIFPHSADTLYNAGYALASSGKDKEAMLFFENALTYYPCFKEAWLALADSAARMGDEKKAVFCIENAVKCGHKPVQQFIENTDTNLKGKNDERINKKNFGQD